MKLWRLSFHFPFHLRSGDPMSEEFLVRDFMSAPATSLSQNASLLDAVLTFRRTQYRHFPIVDGETVVVIVGGNSCALRSARFSLQTCYSRSGIKPGVTEDPAGAGFPD